MRRYPEVLNVLVIAVTVVFVALALVVGRAQAEEAPMIRVGQLSPQEFIAPRYISIEDAEATAAARAEAAAAVETRYSIDPLASNILNQRLVIFKSSLKTGLTPCRNHKSNEGKHHERSNE